MEVLALEHDAAGAASAGEGAYTPALLRAEALRVWELTQDGVVRRTWFRDDRHAAVLLLEVADVAAARDVLATLPLVAAGLIDFDVVPLRAYPGLARLWADGA
jgi:muconolactone delta-isomerase